MIRSTFFRRATWISLGAACLCGPLLGTAALIGVAPDRVAAIVADYAGTNLKVIDAERNEIVPALSLRYLSAGWKLYGERIAIAAIARIYNVLGPALLISGVLALAALATHVAARRWILEGRRLAVGETALFLLLALAAALLLGTPQKPAIVLMASAVFFLNYALPSLLLERWKELAPVIAGASLAGIAHLFAPALLSAFIAWCVLPGSRRAANAAVQAGRASTCLVSMPLIALFLASGQPAPLSKQARELLATSSLYDIEIDPRADHWLVGRKKDGACFVFNRGTLKIDDCFFLRTPELEDIALDAERREIYHVNRETREILVYDADNFRLRRAGTIPDASSAGSVKLALDPSSNRLLVSFEDNNLFLVDGGTLESTLIGKTGNVNLLPDPRNGVVYVNSAQNRWLDALDLKQRKVLHRAPSSGRGERMALSEKRQELYAPDAEDGLVWVYSTPDLSLVRKISVEFGVRPIAVDDEHGLLLTASVVTGYVEVTDLETGRKLARHYVGKYGRILRVDPALRRALITLTNDGLYVLNY